MTSATQPVSQPQAEPAVSTLGLTTPEALPVVSTAEPADFGVVLRVMLAE